MRRIPVILFAVFVVLAMTTCAALAASQPIPLDVTPFIGGAAQGVPEGTLLGVNVYFTNPDAHRPIKNSDVTLVDNNDASVMPVVSIKTINGGSDAQVVFGKVPVCTNGGYSVTVTLNANGNRTSVGTLAGSC